MNKQNNFADIHCDPLSSRTKDGKAIEQPILIGNSIVCDGYFVDQAGLPKTTAIFSHFHDDHTWDFNRTLRNCHNVLMTESTYRALKALKNFPDRPSIHKLEYNEKFSTSTGEIIKLVNANHVPGSAQVLVEMEQTGEKILYSGDFSFPNIPTPNADILVLDGTHGTKDYDFDTDKESVLRGIFKEVCDSIEENKPIEIHANRGTMQDIMAQLQKTEDGRFIPDDIPFLADQLDVALTDALKYAYDVEFREIEISTNSRLNELYCDEKKPYVNFSRPGYGTLQQNRAKIIQADVNPNFKSRGAFWTDKNGKLYACLAAHASFTNIKKYVELIDPEMVLVDGTRCDPQIALSLANTISKEFGITSYSKNCRND